MSQRVSVSSLHPTQVFVDELHPIVVRDLRRLVVEAACAEVTFDYGNGVLHRNFNGIHGSRVC